MNAALRRSFVGLRNDFLSLGDSSDSHEQFQLETAYENVQAHQAAVQRSGEEIDRTYRRLVYRAVRLIQTTLGISLPTWDHFLLRYCGSIPGDFRDYCQASAEAIDDVLAEQEIRDVESTASGETVRIGQTVEPPPIVDATRILPAGLNDAQAASGAEGGGQEPESLPSAESKCGGGQRGESPAPVAAEQPAQPQANKSARMTSRELADKYGVDEGRLRRRLDRWRRKHDGEYIESSNVARNEPKFLYNESAVMPVIEALKSKTAGRKRATGGQQKNI